MIVKNQQIVDRILLLQVLLVLLVVAIMPHHELITGLGIGLLPVTGMLVDAALTFSDAQALTVTAVSTNLYDQGAPPSGTAERRIGSGEPMALVLTVDVAAAGGGTLQIDVQTDDNAGFSSAVVHATSGAVAAAALTAGAKVIIPLIPGKVTERYMRLNYTLTTMTGITVTAMLMPMNQIQNELTYPKNFVVSI